MNIKITVLCCVAFLLITAMSCSNSENDGNEEVYEADVIIYGGTSSAVIAAVQVAKMGKSVIVVSPDKHLGGLTASGLGFTDTGKRCTVTWRLLACQVSDHGSLERVKPGQPRLEVGYVPVLQRFQHFL